MVKLSLSAYEYSVADLDWFISTCLIHRSIPNSCSVTDPKLFNSASAPFFLSYFGSSSGSSPMFNIKNGKNLARNIKTVGTVLEK